ncbi:MAG TPA: MFS transporter [Xanthobacteraceae bacterium]|nr:MFS transporter [Xanthobacteraceae bacterium]
MDGTSSQRLDITLLLVARGIRGFGDGFAAIVLPAYLVAIGFGTVEIGIVAAASLFGSALLTLGVGVVAPRYELRHLLIAGAVLMAATGVMLNVEDLLLIVAVAFIGTVNPSAGDVGMLVPLEQTVLARDVTDRDRTRVFARYSLIGAMSSAAGALSAAVPDVLVDAGIGRVTAFKLMFCCYGVLGLLAAALYRRLRQSGAEQHHVSTPLGPSRGMVYKLAVLFSLDAFAGGFIVQSLLALWLFKRFGISLSAASLFFFWTGVLSALSYPLASWLARRIGLVNTMVFTHIPSSVCLIAAAFAPNLTWVLGLLLVRSALSQMDVPTRTSYVMAVVTPAERAAAASVTAVPRSLASSISPALAGALFGPAFSGLPLVLCGTLKIAYDLALLYTCRRVKPPEENLGNTP